MLIICFPEDKDKGDLIVKMEIVIADNNDEAGAGRASEIPEPSQPKRKISKNPSEDLSTESPDSGKVQFLAQSDLNLDDCYLCLDCGNKFLANSDALYDHCEKFNDHLNILPVCAFNKASVRLRDVATTKSHGPLVTRLRRRLEKSRKRKREREGGFQTPAKRSDLDENLLS